MAKQQVHLAIDLGASSGRVIAGIVQDQQLELDVIHRFENGPVRIQDSLQWDVVGLWREILVGLTRAANRFDEITSVGVDTWGVDFVLLDDHDQFAGPVRAYRDTRNQGLQPKAFEVVSRAEIFQATGLQFMDINSLYQLLAAKWNSDPILERADVFLMMGDFFHWLLTGRRGVELTNASTTQLLDPRTKQWRTDLIGRFELPARIFGELIEPGTNLGPVQPSVASATGLRDVPVIVPATHDTASAVLAVPAKEFAPSQPSWCYISSGTWSLMGCELPEPKIDDTCSELNFTNEGGVFGSTRLLKNIGGLWVFQQIRQSLLRRGEEVSWESMVEQASRAKPFSVSIDPDAPELVAPNDMIDAIEKLLKKSGQSLPESNGELFRSALEGLALRYQQCHEMLQTLVGNRIDTIHIVGGGAKNELLCQMTADACQRQVITGPVEATAIGNVLMQMIGTDKLESVDQARELVRNSFNTKTYQPS